MIDDLDLSELQQPQWSEPIQVGDQNIQARAQANTALIGPGRAPTGVRATFMGTEISESTVPNPSPTSGLKPSDSGSIQRSDFDLIYPKGRSAALSLLVQNQMVQDVLRDAFQLVEKHLFTVNGLPSTLERATIARNALVNSANTLSFHSMAQRITSDTKYRKDLSSLVTSTHVCTRES